MENTITADNLEVDSRKQLEVLIVAGLSDTKKGYTIEQAKEILARRRERVEN
ncbi:hypothetical protein IJH33_02605 [Candidatus Saccharibacteria bacterium]|nr:hypothetical protein [Candidatus Saccharibacteria bacterium]